MNRSRVIRPADLISGAVLAQIATAAKDRACMRELTQGRPSGVSLEDVEEAINQEFRAAARLLTPENCHLHLHDLPRDTDVLDVAFHERKVDGPPIRYLNLQAA